MLSWVAVACGGAVGSLLRFLVGSGLQRVATNHWSSWPISAWPLGTWSVNVVGSFVLALILPGLSSSPAETPHVRLFFATGVCGGFTTYSTFTWECIQQLDEGRGWEALLYVVMTLIGGLGAAIFGLWLSRYLRIG